MRAALIREVGAAPELVADHPGPEGEVVVDVTAAPINPVDLSIAAGRFYAGPPNPPYVPGVEGVSINAAARRTRISWRPEAISLATILDRLHRVGYRALPLEARLLDDSRRRESRACSVSSMRLPLPGSKRAYPASWSLSSVVVTMPRCM